MSAVPEQDVRAAFDALVDEFYTAWFRFHPETAVEIGVYRYADRLTPYAEDEIGALIALNEKLLAGLDDIDFAALDAARQLDYRLLAGQARIEHQQLLEQDWRRRDPLRYLPINAIYQLTVLPVDNFAAALTERLAAIPGYLRGARAQLLDMPELIPSGWLLAAVESAHVGCDYLRELDRLPRVQQAFPRSGELHTLLEQAIHAVQDYAHFLESELAPQARGEFACGRGLFDRLLRERHGLDVDADQLHAFGERLFVETQAALLEVTRELRADGDVLAQVQELQQRHPAPEQLLDSYREQMQAARQFVEQQDLVSLPGQERLNVVETPGFLRNQIPFAAYMPPVPNDPEQQAYYYVTPAEDERLLGEHNWDGLMHTCVHEAWPGHHLQFVTANLIPRAHTWPRLVNTSATLYEGWALYCEQLMLEQGFLNRNEQRFILLRDRLWRALRIMLDVELHTRHLGLDEAADRMSAALGFPREQALADLAWYSRSPTVPMGYATGWRLIVAARDACLAEDMPLKTFHDRLLGEGSVALPLVLRQAFGETVWQRAQACLLE